jgi:hypothetical protein
MDGTLLSDNSPMKTKIFLIFVFISSPVFAQSEAVRPSSVTPSRGVRPAVSPGNFSETLADELSCLRRLKAGRLAPEDPDIPFPHEDKKLFMYSNNGVRGSVYVAGDQAYF